MTFGRNPIYSFYTRYSIYFRMVVYLKMPEVEDTIAWSRPVPAFCSQEGIYLRVSALFRADPAPLLGGPVGTIY